MNGAHSLLFWIMGAGAGLGALNALVTNNAFFLPSTLAVAADKRILRPGLIANVLIGAVGSFGAFVAIDYGFCARSPLPSALCAILVGALSARCLTDIADKQLLRAAVVKACGAPAAHPDTVRSLEFSPPYAVYLTASRLAPALRSFRESSS